ncbi:MAG: TraR/DksA C4-type zinc finger protein [Burkholderiales bacterium]
MPPRKSAPRKSSSSAISASDARLCVECGDVIPPACIVATPTVTRCVSCQSKFELAHDTRRRVDEGLGGTREDHKKMRGQLRSDMRNRGRGG